MRDTIIISEMPRLGKVPVIVRVEDKEYTCEALMYAVDNVEEHPALFVNVANAVSAFDRRTGNRWIPGRPTSPPPPISPVRSSRPHFMLSSSEEEEEEPEIVYASSSEEEIDPPVEPLRLRGPAPTKRRRRNNNGSEFMQKRRKTRSDKGKSRGIECPICLSGRELLHMCSTCKNGFCRVCFDGIQGQGNDANVCSFCRQQIH